MFHDCSEYIYTWISRQNHVKEESLTDWLLYKISELCDFIYYQAFTRHEEAQNGCDWEWWVLTKDSKDKHIFNAYRFLVQAKKLHPNGKDNYPLICYGNKYGTQVDLLLYSARKNNALPLYMFYSIGKADISEQINNVTYISKHTLYCCQDCVNGCYLSLANTIYDLLYNTPRKKILDSELLNNSFKLSILDKGWEMSKNDIDILLDSFNQEWLRMQMTKNEKYVYFDQYGMKYDDQSIPTYLKVFIQNKNKDMNWFENEMRINDILGMGVIDLR